MAQSGQLLERSVTPEGQFRVLYRQFLFRVFDLEVLSAQAHGSANRLLGQFAALLVFVSASVGLLALLSAADPNAPPPDPATAFVVTLITQHFLIATTMLAVGLFAVLSWDTTFPDRRDVLVLAPLPVRARVIFAAKITAVASALGLTIMLLHSIMGLVWPLVFNTRAAPATLPLMTFDPTPVPVAARDLKTVLDRDFRQPWTEGLGMAVGVSKRGEQRIFTYGSAKSDSIFEIGSITKTFTGLALARMVTQGKARLDEPVRKLLPPGTVAKPNGPEITLLDLATHHSGLPPIPDNYDHTEDRPFSSYAAQQLYGWLRTHGVAKDPDATFVYSNFGMGLLGHALALRAGSSYADLMRDEITGPLGMTGTTLKVPDEQRSRFLQGYDGQHRPVEPLVLGVLAGAGELHSTAGDMLTFLDANLYPEKFGPLSAALTLSHQIRDTGDAGQQVALAWAYSPDSGTWWHNGGTSGFISYAFFNPRVDCAGVVLINSGPNPLLPPVNTIGEHIRQRLSGEPAISLDTLVVTPRNGFSGLLRQFGAYWFTMLAAGIFVYAAVLNLQGIAALVLPRRVFLRLSGYLQIAAICLILGVYFLQPGFGGLDDLAFGSIYHAIQWLPSYWFLGLYQQLNGTMHPALAPLAQRSWTALAALICGTPLLYALCYLRTLRTVVEEPDILPARRRLSCLPRFGNQPQTAIAQFTIRTLARSRQHRMVLAFYLGIGLAIVSLMLKEAKRERSAVLWAASVVMIVLAVVGTRVAFALPLDLRANWIVRVIGVRGGQQTLVATRRALLALSVAPVWLATAIGCVWLRLGRQNIGHLVVLAFLGLLLVDICLLRFRKVPFTCSWLPGKSQIHMTFLGALGLLMAGVQAARLERDALRQNGNMVLMFALLALAWIAVRILANREQQDLRFEEDAPQEVYGLGLYRDGVMRLENRQTPG